MLKMWLGPDYGVFSAILRRHGFTLQTMGTSRAEERLEKWETEGREAKLQPKSR